MYNMTIEYVFEWDVGREGQNLLKHGIPFQTAMEVFADPDVIHLEDEQHSSEEDRFYAVGRVASGEVITVRYTVRRHVIRIFGAAKWRKWRTFYERANSKP